MSRSFESVERTTPVTALVPNPNATLRLSRKGVPKTPLNRTLPLYLWCLTFPFIQFNETGTSAAKKCASIYGYEKL